MVGDRVIWLHYVNSTNDYAAKYSRDSSSHGLIVVADYQTEGKGQRGNTWESQLGVNLLFSLVLKPSFLKVQRQFLLSKVTALAVCDTIAPLVSGISIKWPNDIYINNSKVAGILIENSFSTSFLDSSIIGVGLNVNQNDFSDDIPNPTSLFRNLNQEISSIDLLDRFCECFDLRYNMLVDGDEGIISNDYFELLYRKDSYYNYQSNNERFKAKIFGVRDSGELVLQTDSGELREYAFKEVSFIID